MTEMTTAEAPAAAGRKSPRGSGTSCEDVVASVMLSVGRKAVENRRWTRQPYEEAVLLQPVETDGETPAGQPVIVRGLDISMAGLSFAHEKPFRTNQFVAGLRDSFGHVQPLLVTLRWTRLAVEGGYVSGGRFVSPSAIALPEHVDWERLASA